MSITYCPLTNSAIGYYGKLSSGETSFGTSGKLVNSNLIMYDRGTESYWSQILGTAITGPAKGDELERFPVIWSKWDLVKTKYEHTRILLIDTGFNRDYYREILMVHTIVRQKTLTIITPLPAWGDFIETISALYSEE